MTTPQVRVARQFVLTGQSEDVRVERNPDGDVVIKQGDDIVIVDPDMAEALARCVKELAEER